MDIVIKIKELQRKIDHSLQLQRHTPHLKSTSPKNSNRLDNKHTIENENDSVEKTLSLMQKSIIKIENRMDTMEGKIDRILNFIDRNCK